jgi:CobQ/CobB/MinD/ParA nucleotide binding domain
VTIRFDDSLPLLVRIIAAKLGDDAIRTGVALRDATGRLAFFAGTPLDSSTVDAISTDLRAALGPYARSDRILASSDDYGASDILSNLSIQNAKSNGRTVRLLDRRLVGADWLREPSPIAPPPPRFVFSSLKGGVGRSTALCVAAADFAARGRRVLAVDLDLEAPGLSAMLLNEKTVPEFGLLDALVESGIAPLDDSFLADLAAPSALADRRGRIDVVPAFGRRSLENPAEVLAKVSRAYTDHISDDGTVSTMLDQVRRVIDRLTELQRYDAIFVDARAGLHETTAAAVLGLGAEVFLFGLDEPQTFQGYAALLAHLARFVRPATPAPEWLERITMVQGRAASLDAHTDFSDKCRTLFMRIGLLSPETISTDVQLPAEPFNDVPWDSETRDEDLPRDADFEPSEPLAILEDNRFRLFDPAIRQDLLSEQVHRSSFGRFLDTISNALPADGESRT